MTITLNNYSFHQTNSHSEGYGDFTVNSIRRLKRFFFKCFGVINYAYYVCTHVFMYACMLALMNQTITGTE